MIVEVLLEYCRGDLNVEERAEVGDWEVLLEYCRGELNVEERSEVGDCEGVVGVLPWRLECGREGGGR